MPCKKGTPRYYYHNQKTDAKRRGIAWEFTFETWWKTWQDSGKWDKRGCEIGQYVQGRKGDKGPYSPTNVLIVEAGENGRAALLGWPTKKKAREDREEAEKRAAQTKVEDPKTQSSSYCYRHGKEVADSEASIATAAQTFLEIGQRYGQPQFSSLNHNNNISSHKLSK